MKIAPKNWQEFQHYKDRSPPWIKLHRGLLDDFDFQCLPVASRALAPMLWLLAADSKDPKTGEIDADPSRLAFRLRMSECDVADALKPLIANGFFFVVQDASATLAVCRQLAVPETEGETEEEKSNFVDSAAPTDQKTSRLAEVTNDAVDSYNANMSRKGHGKLAAVTIPDSDQRRKQVKRAIKLAARVCADLYGETRIVRTFWDDYFAECRKDPFLSGDGPYSGAHANWRPDFEYLTRPDVIERVLDKALSHV